MTRAKFDGRLFIVSHYQAPLENDQETTVSSPIKPEANTENERQPGSGPETESTGDILSSSTSTTSFGKYSSSKTSTKTPTPIRYDTPPASAFKQVKWLDSPTPRTPLSRSQTPGGHNEDSDTEYITAAAAAINKSSNSNSTTTNSLKTPTARHIVTHHWQEHILLEDPHPARRWGPSSSSSSSNKRHGNDRTQTRSMPENDDDDNPYEHAATERQRHVSAEELEISLERYEREGRRRRSRSRKLRTQSAYLPVPESYDEDEVDEEEREKDAEGNNYTIHSSNGKDPITNTMNNSNTLTPQTAPTFRRWSDVHRIAAQFEKSASSSISDSTDREFGRYGRLGVGR